MSGVESPVQETQKVLLERQLLQAFGRLEGERPRLLAFDSSFGGAFKEAGYDVVTAHPNGPFPAGERFDVILGVGFLEHARDDRSSLAAMRDHLTDSGLIVLAPPAAIAGRRPPDGALRQYSLDELGSLVWRAGLMATALWTDGPELLVCELRPSTVVGSEMVARVAELVGRSSWVEAEAALSSATEQMQHEELVREYAMLIGHVHLSRGRLGEALEAFNDAENLGAPSCLPYTGMGAVALSAHDVEAATDLFKAALELCPTHASALHGLGMISKVGGDLEAALTYFDMAATQRPSERELAERVVELSVAVGRADPAKHAIKRCVAVSGDEHWAKKLLDKVTPLAVTEKLHKATPSPSPALGGAGS